MKNCEEREHFLNSNQSHIYTGDAPTSRSKCRCRISAENVLLIFTICGVMGGVVLGVGMRKVDPPLNQRYSSYLRFPGEIFLRMLQMCILPLIVSSIISSLGSLDSATAGRLGLCALIFYTSTTFSAVFLGIILVTTIKPGKWVSSDGMNLAASGKQPACISNALDTIFDLVRNLFPSNLVEATSKGIKTCMTFYNVTGNVSTQIDRDVALKLTWEERAKYVEKPETVQTSGMNILGLVMFSVIFGIVVGRMGKKGKPLAEFFTSLEQAMMQLVSLVIWFSPIGVAFLIAAQILEMDDPYKELKRLTGYMITVLVGLAIHAVVILPTLLIVLARRNPLKYTYGMLQALLTALGTSSSSATLPLSIKCVEENNHVDSRVARFVLPLGATINMDGTALYEAVAAIYIAQTVGVDLSPGGIIMISLTATLASVGAAGIPQAGIVTMIMVLIAVGLPTNLFILIIPVDFFLDRIRTTVNVHGDSIGAAVVEKLCESHLKSTAADVEMEANDDGGFNSRPAQQHQGGKHEPNMQSSYTMDL